MTASRVARNRAAIAILSLLCAALFAGEDSFSAIHHFKITLHGDGEGPTADVRLISDMEICYTRKQHQNIIEAWCDSTSNTGKVNDKVMSDFYMDRSKLIVQQGSERKEYTPEKEPQLKQMLEDSFGKALMTFELNANGQEINKAYSEAPGAKMLIENASMENCVLFHGQRPPPDAKWTRKIDYSTSGRTSASFTGEFTYELLPGTDSEPNLRVYKVSGALKCDAFSVAGISGQPTDSKMKFEGRQVYNSKLQEWVFGEFKNSLTMHFPDQKAGTFSTCIYTLKQEILKPQN